MATQPAQATVVVIGKDAYAALDLNFHEVDELMRALKANSAAQIELSIDAETVEDYERIGKVIFSLARNGLELVAINGVAIKDQPPP